MCVGGGEAPLMLAVSRSRGIYYIAVGEFSTMSNQGAELPVYGPGYTCISSVGHCGHASKGRYFRIHGRSTIVDPKSKI